MILKKIRLLIEPSKYFGKIILLKDVRGRISLKFTFSQRFAGTISLSNPSRNINELNLDKYLYRREAPKGYTMELSYKFENKKLEQKYEIKGGPIERSFYDVNVPASSPLFLLRMGSIHVLENVIILPGDIVVNDGLWCNSVMINVSFGGPNGNPFLDRLFRRKKYVKKSIHLGKTNPSKLYIISGCDNVPKDYGLLTYIPEDHIPTKST